jgi:hypothetical protein
MRGAIIGVAIVLVVALVIEVLTGDAHPVVVTKIAMWAGAIGYYADKAGG